MLFSRHEGTTHARPILFHRIFDERACKTKRAALRRPLSSIAWVEI
jgi:hypothetical protein